ncbi:MAG: GTPase RsgA, partial [Ruminiclostridium sp.]|nr:GTPase RsgA [Ruminiclostridium sp.]
KAGYSCVCASAKTGEGVSEIQSMINGNTVAFAGLSGVGKSSL